MLTRRMFLQSAAGLAAAGTGLGGYAVAEPFWLAETHYRISPPNWPAGLKLRLVALADLHVCEPWMGLARVRHIVARANALAPDAVLLLGDYVAGHGISRVSQHVPDQAWADALGRLSAPFGVHAILGNHDWWDDDEVQRARAGIPSAGRALQAAGIRLHENTAVRMEKAGHGFWIAGLGDQWSFWRAPAGHTGQRPWSGYWGVHDLPRTLAAVTDDAPIVMMVHEPDIFTEIPDRVALTLAGHTHGGQVTFLGYAPVVPSRYGRRYLYGHIVENGRNLVVSGGLGCGGVPLRLGVPPEIVVVDIEAGEPRVA